MAFNILAWDSFLHYYFINILILLVLEWTFSEHIVVTRIGRCLLFLPVQHSRSFGPSIVWVPKWSKRRQLFNDHAIQWLVVGTAVVMGCPMCFRHTYVCPGGGGSKQRMQLRVANYVPLVRNNSSFLPLVGTVSKRLWWLNELNSSCFFLQKVSKLKARLGWRSLNSTHKTTFSEVGKIASSLKVWVFFKL